MDDDERGVFNVYIHITYRYTYKRECASRRIVLTKVLLPLTQISFQRFSSVTSLPIHVGFRLTHPLYRDIDGSRLPVATVTTYHNINSSNIIRAFLFSPSNSNTIISHRDRPVQCFTKLLLPYVYSKNTYNARTKFSIRNVYYTADCKNRFCTVKKV